MVVWVLIIIVFGAGLIGGTINALISDNGFVFPKREAGILRPGWLGNALIGGVAAAVSWSLYGPLAATSIVAATGEGTATKGDLTLAAIGGAILVGMAGARWLSNEVDKLLLRAAGIEAAKKQPNKDLVTTLSTGSPAAAFQAAQLASEEEPGPELRRQ
jgi:cytochrome c biogenesis protein CcdA